MPRNILEAIRRIEMMFCIVQDDDSVSLKRNVDLQGEPTDHLTLRSCGVWKDHWEEENAKVSCE